VSVLVSDAKFPVFSDCLDSLFMLNVLTVSGERGTLEPDEDMQLEVKAS